MVAVAGPEWSLWSVLEHVLAHLGRQDLQHFWLTAFTYHPAVMTCCIRARSPETSYMLTFQAGLSFLQRLPNLRALALKDPRTLLGTQHLTNLHRWTS